MKYISFSSADKIIVLTTDRLFGADQGWDVFNIWLSSRPLMVVHGNFVQDKADE